jgi:hypothetical protein
MSKKEYLSEVLSDRASEFDSTVIPIRDNPYLREINRAGKAKNLKFFLFYAGKKEKFFLLSENKFGIRSFFMWVEEPNGAFRQMDSRTVLHVKQVLEYHGNAKRFFKDMLKKRTEVKEKKDKKEMDEFNYICGQYKRLFQRLSRVLGYTGGKTNLPY